MDEVVGEHEEDARLDIRRETEVLAVTCSSIEGLGFRYKTSENVLYNSVFNFETFGTGAFFFYHDPEL